MPAIERLTDPVRGGGSRGRRWLLQDRRRHFNRYHPSRNEARDLFPRHAAGASADDHYRTAPRHANDPVRAVGIAPHRGRQRARQASRADPDDGRRQPLAGAHDAREIRVAHSIADNRGTTFGGVPHASVEIVTAHDFEIDRACLHAGALEERHNREGAFELAGALPAVDRGAPGIGKRERRNRNRSGLPGRRVPAAVSAAM